MPMTLVHGWGAHGAIWQSVRPLLASRGHPVLTPDLPGHGQGPAVECDLDAHASSLAAQGQAGVWVGWSLGGLAVIRLAALRPDLVRAMVLVAATPRFCQAPDWPDAMPGGLLAQFARQLETDRQRTLRRFLALQVQGSEGEAARLGELRNLWLDGPAPSPQGLTCGLRLLQQSDLREPFSHWQGPTLIVLGQRDTLVPARAGQAMQQLVPHARVQIMEGCGHAPFVAQPPAFAEAVLDFAAGTPSPPMAVP